MPASPRAAPGGASAPSPPSSPATARRCGGAAVGCCPTRRRRRRSRRPSAGPARRAGYDRAELVRSLELAPATDEELERRAVIRETLRSVAALPAQRRATLLRATADPHRSP